MVANPNFFIVEPFFLHPLWSSDGFNAHVRDVIPLAENGCPMAETSRAQGSLA
jgi:hypothetical protein